MRCDKPTNKLQRPVRRLAPEAPDRPSPARIDKSKLALPEPWRPRDKAHLKSVTSQPYFVCGQQPCDTHSNRFVLAPPKYTSAGVRLFKLS